MNHINNANKVIPLQLSPIHKPPVPSTPITRSTPVNTAYPNNSNILLLTSMVVLITNISTKLAGCIMVL